MTINNIFKTMVSECGKDETLFISQPLLHKFYVENGLNGYSLFDEKYEEVIGEELNREFIIISYDKPVFWVAKKCEIKNNYSFS